MALAGIAKVAAEEVERDIKEVLQLLHYSSRTVAKDALLELLDQLAVKRMVSFTGLVPLYSAAGGRTPVLRLYALHNRRCVRYRFRNLSAQGI